MTAPMSFELFSSPPGEDAVEGFENNPDDGHSAERGQGLRGRDDAVGVNPAGAEVDGVVDDGKRYVGQVVI
jgi:hypothetical protein